MQALLAALLIGWQASDRSGPFDITLFAGPAAPTAAGAARLVFADSPFGISVTADGRHRYDVRISTTGLPSPPSLGMYTAFVAWEVSTDLSTWHRLGEVRNGANVVGTTESNKFLLVVTAEHDAATTTHSGPTILHGTSPSGWLQTFLTHPLFRGIAQ